MVVGVWSDVSHRHMLPQKLLRVHYVRVRCTTIYSDARDLVSSQLFD